MLLCNQIQQGRRYFLKTVAATGVTVGLLLAPRRLPAADAWPLVKDGRARAVIVVASQAHDVERFAAQQFQHYLRKISGAELTIIADDDLPEGPAVVIGAHPAAERVRSQLDARHSGRREALAVVIESDRLFLLGRCHTATVYAVWDYLESLGVRWLLPTERGEYVPHTATILAPTQNRFDTPHFRYRGPSYGTSLSYGAPEEAVTPVFRDHSVSRLFGYRHRLNDGGALDEADGWPNIGSGHSYDNFLNPDRYFNQHPEWFAMIDGQRRVGQVCFTNAGAAAEFARNLLADVERTVSRDGMPIPHMRISVSPNDGVAKCECDNCRPLIDADGSASSLATLFANRVADHVRRVHPDAKIVFYAYSNHSTFPDHVKPGPGVHPELVFWTASNSFAANHAHPMFSDANAKFREQWRQWSNHSEALSAYQYYGHFDWFTPWPQITQMAHDIPILAQDPKCYGMYAEMHLHFGTQALNFYVYPKLLWNPQLDVRTTIEDYCRYAYGPAAEPFLKYYDLLQAQMDGQGYINGSIAEVPQVLTPSVVEQCNALMDQAEQHLSAMDAAMRWRTELTIAAWRASAWTAEAVHLFRSGGDRAAAQRIVDLLARVDAFAHTEMGRWAFETRMLTPMLDSLRRPFQGPLDALPEGTHAWSDHFGFGGGIKFLGRVEGFQPGIWGYSLPTNGHGVFELPVAAAEGAKLSAMTVRMQLAGPRPASGRLIAVDADGQQHLIANTLEAMSAGATVPTAVLARGPVRLRVEATNHHHDLQIIFIGMSLDATVGASD